MSEEMFCLVCVLLHLFCIVFQLRNMFFFRLLLKISKVILYCVICCVVICFVILFLVKLLYWFVLLKL